MMNKWREKFAGFMVGRYGADRLGQFLIGVSLFFLLLGIFIRKPWVDILAFACLILCYFRMFSRNIGKRRNTISINVPAVDRRSGFPEEKGKSAFTVRSAIRILLRRVKSDYKTKDNINAEGNYYEPTV